MTGATWVPMTDDVAAIRLSSDALIVDVLPGNGADVQAVRDRRTDTDLLWTSPWGTGLSPELALTSRDRWLTRAWGGWQLLLPNTGDEATEGDRTWGFHGEAGMRAWTVAAAGPDEARLELDLDTAPLSLRRTYRVAGPTLTIDTTVTNGSTGPVEYLWGEHPTYGEAFAAGATLEVDADSFVVEIADPSLGLAAGDRMAWPGSVESAFGSLDQLPFRAPSRFLFGFIDGLRSGTYRIRNDRLGLAARLDWPLDVFPCLWLWEEIAYTRDQPWNGQAYAVGIEPQTAYPALGMTELRRRGGHGLLIGTGAVTTATVTLSVEHPDDP